ncbi:MAG TPA: pyridoxal phosphate-dependent aminotransferase [Vicinamibacterales bacterium]|nr:pyridoxal phosphate-dependent aminotransferase [Vicinamibacterales bacterium]
MFSDRVPRELTVNRLTQAVADFERSGRRVIDLTASNPTRAGFDYPADLLAPLADSRALVYAPSPLGLPSARAAIARDYARQGLDVPPERIVLTASTSDAYSMIFKLLTDAGDEVLVPRPSYPLFEPLTRLELVVTRPYDLDIHGGWTIDIDSVERAMTPRTRVLLIVSPNNPTGSYVRAEELDRLAARCAPRGVAIVADEVFADYELAAGAARSSGRAATRTDVLTFALGGLSKSAGLPQVKLGWIAVGGPDTLAREAIARLEHVCDTYLAVSTPVQLAAGALIERGASVREQIARRVAANYATAVAARDAAPEVRVLASDGGWYVVLQVPSLDSEESLVLDLLTTDEVLVHPGYFFDFPREAFLIVSLLPPPASFDAGIDRVLRHFACGVGRP